MTNPQSPLTKALRPAFRTLPGSGSLALLVLAGAALAADAPAPAQLEFFEARIRPVLIDQCYECHNSSGKAEGEFALDDRQSLLKGGEHGPVLVPGKPADSRLLKILRHEIDGLEMPQGRGKLDERVIADFAAWIAAGAPDPRDAPPSAEELAKETSWEAVLAKRKQWWSFRPIQPPQLPGVKESGWSDHPVDRFLLARLEEQPLTPAEPADPATLVRRLYFVLIGLPPTADEALHWTARFTGPDGKLRQDEVAALADQLLASPHFGEHWARHWMDWIRYAESHGSEGDPEIVNAWLYRDYLIRALNADIPYDQLVREHLAGDLLEQPRLNRELGLNESLLGTAHWRMVYHGFSPTDALDEKVRFIDDQINTFSKAFLALTVSCARCHDHKFDAISQKDYYALFGILGSCRPGRAAMDLPERERTNADELAALKPKIRDALADEWLSAIPALTADWFSADGLASKSEKPGALLQDWRVVHGEAPEAFRAAWERRVVAHEQDRQRRAEFAARSFPWRWDFAQSQDYRQWHRAGLGLPPKPVSPGEFAVAATGDKPLAGIFPAGVYSHLLSPRHAARLTSDRLRLDGDYEVWVRFLGDGTSTFRYVVQDYPRSGNIYPVLKSAPEWKWQKLDLAYWSGDDIHFELTHNQDAPLLVGKETRSWFGVRDVLVTRKGESGPPGETREHLDVLFESAAAAPPANLDDLAACYSRTLTAAIGAWRQGAASPAQAAFLAAFLDQNLLPNQLDRLLSVRPLIEDYRRLESGVPVPTRIPALEETIGRNQPLFVRGDHKHPADPVPRRFLEAIDSAPYDTPFSGRRQLAEDLLRPDNPLTRRVIVNRLWHHLFGEGLVRSPDNFGKLGQQPTHPELLDWLAIRFSDQGWSLKSMVRELVATRTWQLSSHPSPRSHAIDPDNLLWSHAQVRRLEAEAIRDELLAVSGQLSPERYGPPVGGSAPRRSLYIDVRRNALDPFLRAFDFPEPFTAVGRRDATNVPAQSLTLMNDPRLVEDARAWVRQVSADSALDDNARIGRLFLAAFARQPTPAELIGARDYLQDARRTLAELAAQAASLQTQIAAFQQELQDLTEPVRQRLSGDARTQYATAQRSAPLPISRWEFEQDLKDSLGSAHGEAKNGAKIENGALVLRPQAYAVTPPLSQSLTEKTLEAWVQLDNLEQRGAGVMSLQTPDGAVFDALVFAEKDPKQWLAGSDHFRRTESLQGPPEQEALGRPVHLAMAWHADGRIAAYRDGQPYGRSYHSQGPVEFKAGRAVVGFGIRHLPAGGNKMLSGRIFRAQLYDRALTPEEIRVSAQSGPAPITAQQVLAALEPSQRARYDAAQARLGELQRQLSELQAPAEAHGELAPWVELARALFVCKEFIYLR